MRFTRKIYLYLFITLLKFTLRVKGHQAENSILDQVISTQNVLTKSDLIWLSKALSRVTNFFYTNRNEIDLSVKFGIILINVNLKKIERYRENLPKVQSSIILHIEEKCDKMIRYFDQLARKHASSRNLSVSNLMSNQKTWTDQIRNFKFKELDTSMYVREFIEDNPSIETYEKNVVKINEHIPTPIQSYHCITSIANDVLELTQGFRKCVIEPKCYHIILNGTDFGYALTHRFLQLLLARFGRKCNIFSPYHDAYLTETLCTKMFVEANFLAKHGFRLLDLFGEQIIFCSLYGYPQFMRKSWIEKFSLQQTNYGCFGTTEAKVNISMANVVKGRKWKFLRHLDDFSWLDGVCNMHFTAVAAGVLSTAMRFIVQMYYI